HLLVCVCVCVCVRGLIQGGQDPMNLPQRVRWIEMDGGERKRNGEGVFQMFQKKMLLNNVCVCVSLCVCVCVCVCVCGWWVCWWLCLCCDFDLSGCICWNVYFSFYMEKCRWRGLGVCV